MERTWHAAIAIFILIHYLTGTQLLSAQTSPSPTPSAPPATEASAAATPAPADANLTAELPPRTVLLICRFDDKSAFNASQKQLLFESLATRLGASNPDILIRQYPDMTLPPETDLNQIAIEMGIDAWISIKVGGNMAKANFHFHGYDLQTMKDYFEMDMSAGIDSRFRNAFGGLWLDVEKAVAANIHKNRQINTISFSGPPDTIVEVDSAKVIGPDGAIGFDLPSPANYRWHAYLPGYHYLDGSFFLNSNERVALEFQPKIKFHFDIGLEWLSFPVIRILYQYEPDTWDLELGIVFYNIGIVPGSPRGGDSSFIKDFNLINLLMGVRWYPLQHRYNIRPWFGFGTQIRFQTNPSFGGDSLNPGGLYLQFGTSVDLGRDFALFLELTPRITFSNDNQLALSSLAANGGTNSGFNQMVPVGNNIIIEPWHFIFGIRIQP